VTITSGTPFEGFPFAMLTASHRVALSPFLSFCLILFCWFWKSSLLISCHYPASLHTFRRSSPLGIFKYVFPFLSHIDQMWWQRKGVIFQKLFFDLLKKLVATSLIMSLKISKTLFWLLISWLDLWLTIFSGDQKYLNL
jgi:hypothetical protein